MKKSCMLIFAGAIAAVLAIPSMVVAEDHVLMITVRQSEPILMTLVQPEQLKPAPAAMSPVEYIEITAYDILSADVAFFQPGGAEVTVSEGWLFGAADQQIALINNNIAGTGRMTYEVGWRA